jgi:hypothetical protein
LERVPGNRHDQTAATGPADLVWWLSLERQIDQKLWLQAIVLRRDNCGETAAADGAEQERMNG